LVLTTYFWLGVPSIRDWRCGAALRTYGAPDSQLQLRRQRCQDHATRAWGVQQISRLLAHLLVTLQRWRRAPSRNHFHRVRDLEQASSSQVLSSLTQARTSSSPTIYVADARCCSLLFAHLSSLLSDEVQKKCRSSLAGWSRPLISNINKPSWPWLRRVGSWQMPHALPMQLCMALKWVVVQRQRSQNLTSASGDAIWGAHRPNYIHGQFGGIFFVPQVPPAPRCTPVVISTKLTSRLSLAPCCACQPSFGRIQAAPRRALAPTVEPSPGLVIWPVSGTQSAGHG
jgi:hypothetical protein